MNLTPYRSNALVDQPKAPEAKPKYGILLRPADPPPHQCKTPNWLVHLWYALTGKHIRNRSLFRCHICDTVYEFDTLKGSWGGWRIVSKYDNPLDKWKKLGGAE